MSHLFRWAKVSLWTHMNRSMRSLIPGVLQITNYVKVFDHFSSRPDTQNLLFYQKPRVSIAANIELGALRTAIYRWKDRLRGG